MDSKEKENLLLELRRFSSIRSLEVAKGNLNSMMYVLDSTKKEIQIRKLTVQNYGLSTLYIDGPS